MTESKPGWKTTEFALVVLANILTQAGALEVPDRFKWAVTLATVTGYAISRGLAKQGVPYDRPVSSDPLVGIPVTHPAAIEPDQGDPGQSEAKRGKK